jgi:hypothetical protein
MTGFTSDKDLENYKKKTDIYQLGIETVKKFIQEYQVDCDFNESGKYYGSSKFEDQKDFRKFFKNFIELGF